MTHKRGVFVSGTDTGVGKTFVSSLLVAALKYSGTPVGYFKPVQTGSDLDTPTVSELSGVALSQFSQPTYQFSEPSAPYRASLKEGKQIQLDQIRQHWESLDNRSWVVEGAGGLLVPLNSKHTLRDLVQVLGLK